MWRNKPLKPLVTLIRIIIVGLCWSIFFLEGIRVILLTNWHFDLIDSRHWHYVWDLWMSGWVIDDRHEWAFIFVIFSFIPLWLTGWASLSLIKWEVYLKKLWNKLKEFYFTRILKQEKTQKEKAPAPKPTIKRKKSYKEIRPRSLNSISSTQSESRITSPIAANRTLPNVKPINIPTTPVVATNSILDHSLFKFDEEESDFDLNFDDLDKIQSASKQSGAQAQDKKTENTPSSSPQNDKRSKKENNESNNRSKDRPKENKKSNKSISQTGQQPSAPKNIGNSSLEVLKQKGYQVITSATIKNNFVDFIGVAENQICICLVDKEAGDWLADEERFNDEEPLWFSESSHRISPVRCADIVQKHLKEKLQENGFDFNITTYVIIQYGNIINAEDMFETWDNMHINVTRIDRGMPRELKLFAKSLEEADNTINIEQFEKIKKLIRNLL